MGARRRKEKEEEGWPCFGVTRSTSSKLAVDEAHKWAGRQGPSEASSLGMTCAPNKHDCTNYAWRQCWRLVSGIIYSAVCGHDERLRWQKARKGASKLLLVLSASLFRDRPRGPIFLLFHFQQHNNILVFPRTTPVHTSLAGPPHTSGARPRKAALVQQ